MKLSSQSIIQYHQLSRTAVLAYPSLMLAVVLLTVLIYQSLLVYVLLSVIRKSRYQLYGVIIRVIIPRMSSRVLTLIGTSASFLLDGRDLLMILELFEAQYLMGLRRRVLGLTILLMLAILQWMGC